MDDIREKFKRAVKDKFKGFHFETRICEPDKFQENKLNEYLYFYQQGVKDENSACVSFLKSQIENINDGDIASCLDIYVEHLSESLSKRIK